jgi:kynurenine formamidase
MKNKLVVKSLNFRYADNVYEASEHVGTHIDAPFHMVEDGWKVGDIPLHRFFAPGQSNFKNKKEFQK